MSEHDASPSAPDSLVLRTDHDGVAIVEFNRPARRNALVGPLFDELAVHIEAIAHDQSAQAVVLCGAGGAFSSGLDLKEYNAEPPPAWLATAGESLRRAHVALASCPAPIVVALERYAINGGAAFALAGDLIVAGETAWLQIGEVQQGLPAPMNLAWLTARHPLATVLRLVIPGERVLGPQLAALNIAHEVVEDREVRERAEALAARLAAYPPGAARTIKTASLRLAAPADADAWFSRAQQLTALPEGETFRPGSINDS